MARIYFNEIGFKARKVFKDPVTGKRRQETKYFYQTINPFNKNTDGSIKTKDQIIEELNSECELWMKS